jgi:hypothetical protein
MSEQLYAVLNNGKCEGCGSWSIIHFVPYSEGASKEELLRAWFDEMDVESDEEIYGGKFPWWDHQLDSLKGAWLVTEITKKHIQVGGIDAGNDAASDACTATLLSICKGMAVKVVSF